MAIAPSTGTGPAFDRLTAERGGSVQRDPSAALEATVLTIDDQPWFRSVARQLVESVPGLSLLAEAATGQEGLTLARSLHPDVVLLDVNLPDIDGIEVCRRLREERPAPVVILVSGDDEHEYTAAAQGCGATAFVPKQRLTASLLGSLLRDAWAGGGQAQAGGSAA